MTTFNLPQNDPRLLQLSEREAFDQVLLFQAMNSLKRDHELEATKEAAENFKHKDEYLGGGPARRKVVTGEKAVELADKPKLTGDPEWDAIEVEETAEDREPFDPSILEGLI